MSAAVACSSISSRYHHLRRDQVGRSRIGRDAIRRGDDSPGFVRLLRLNVGLSERVSELEIVRRPSPCGLEPRNRIGEATQHEGGEPEDLLRFPSLNRLRWQAVDDRTKRVDRLGRFVGVIVGHAKQVSDLHLARTVRIGWKIAKLRQGGLGLPGIDQAPGFSQNASLILPPVARRFSGACCNAELTSLR